MSMLIIFTSQIDSKHKPSNHLQFWLIVCIFSVADFECVILPVAVPAGNGKRRKVASTTVLSSHAPCAVAYKVSSSVPEYDQPVQWIYGRNCAAEFVENMKNLHKRAEPILHPKAKMHPMCPAQRASLDAKRTCYLCKKWLIGKRDIDHDHLTGEVNNHRIYSILPNSYLSYSIFA